MWRRGCRREYLTWKTHEVGAGGKKQAENPRLEAGVGEWRRKVGAGANILLEKPTRWVREEESKQKNPDWKPEEMEINLQFPLEMV